jgi:hypothetical protein
MKSILSARTQVRIDRDAHQQILARPRHDLGGGVYGLDAHYHHLVRATWALHELGECVDGLDSFVEPDDAAAHLRSCV